MLRKVHIIALALVAAAVAAPVAHGASPSPSVRIDPLAASYLLQQGYTKNQIIALAGGSSSIASPRKAADPLAVSWLLGHGYSPSQIAAMGVAVPVDSPKTVDPLAVSYLRSLGLTPSEVADWTVGVCSHQVKPASCFAVFDRPAAEAPPPPASDGFAWGDAGIGAAATLGLVLLAAGLGFTLIGRGSRRRVPQPKHV